VSKRTFGSGWGRTRRLKSTSAVVVFVCAVAFSVFGVAAASGQSARSARPASTHAAQASARIPRPASAITRLLFATGTVGTAASFEDDDGNLAPEGLTDWNSFYVIVGSSAGALIGLVAGIIFGGRKSSRVD